MNTKVRPHELAKPLSLGTVVGGSTLQNKMIVEAISKLSFAISEAIQNIQTPLNLNVVFHVPGNLLKPDYSGLRTGSFSKARSLLMVQVAVPEPIPTDANEFVREAVHRAIEEAAKWASKRKVAVDVARLRWILDHACALLHH